MGQRYYWHNITQNVFNENDLSDFVEDCKVGDLIKFTDRGNAIVYDLETLKEDDFREYGYIRKEFLDMFKKYHKKEFFKTANF